MSSDSASPKSKGIRPVSKKKIINNIGKIGNNKKQAHVQEYWKDTIWKKENESNIEIKYITKKFKKISKFNVVTSTRVEDITAYLFFVIHPTKNIKNEKNMDKTPINNKLYSISQTATLGDHIKLIQNK